jgi:hypothetical protein
MQFKQGKILNPGENATIDVYNNDGVAQLNDMARLVLVLCADQNVTVKSYWAVDGVEDEIERSSATYTGGADTVAIYDFLLLPGLNHVTLTTTTAPTEWQAAATLTTERGVGN